jgi:outer membrane protein OmpA-like peptidoglycan-associated protein
MKNIACIIILISFLHCTVVCGSPNFYQPPGKITLGNKPVYTDSSVILIPFDYKQSALYHAFTYEVIDSVVNLLLRDSSITLSINGYAHPDEGNDTICKYLSLNRALFVRDYILGRGVQPFRIILVRGMGKRHSDKSNVNKDGHALNCRAELVLNFPPPPTPPRIEDRDEDGIADADDACADEYGYKENNGCPDKNAIVIPFETQQSWLSPATYKMLDSAVIMLRENPTVKLSVQGHAYPTEGIYSFCERLAAERAEVVKKYLRSRNIADSRIIAVKSFGSSHPYNAGKNPQEIALNSRAQIMLEK